MAFSMWGEGKPPTTLEVAFLSSGEKHHNDDPFQSLCWSTPLAVAYGSADLNG